jgi:hypothetical protein
VGKTRRSHNLANDDGEMFVTADLVRDPIHDVELATCSLFSHSII